MKKAKNNFSLLGFILKAIILPVWIGIFAYPGLWHISIDDQIYMRYSVWRKSSLAISPQILPFADALHRLSYPSHNAAIRGKLERLQGLSQEHLKLETLDTFSMTPLAYAVAGGRMEEIEFFLNAEASPNTPLARGESALFLAIRRGQEKIALRLLEAGGRIDDRNNSGTPAIHLAVQCKMLKLVRQAIADKQPVDVKDAQNLNTLDHAIKSGSLSMVYEIAMAGVTPDFSVSPGNLEISGFLLRWQKTGNPVTAIEAETRSQFDPQALYPPAELPVNINPKTFIEIRGK